jgi:dCTP deaminase
MILSNVEIQRALDEGRLIITPEPGPRRPTVRQPHCPYDTHSVDLRLANVVSIPKNIGGVASIDLSGPGEVANFLQSNSEPLTITSDQPLKLAPNRFVLGRTQETVELPIPPRRARCLAARIEGKSSRARFGLLIHFTAPTVHPGWRGPLTLEIINLGPWTILLTPGMPIAQLIVEEVRGRPFANPSQFQGQETPEGVAPKGRAKSSSPRASSRRSSATRVNRGRSKR